MEASYRSNSNAKEMEAIILACSMKPKDVVWMFQLILKLKIMEVLRRSLQKRLRVIKNLINLKEEQSVYAIRDYITLSYGRKESKKPARNS